MDWCTSPIPEAIQTAKTKGTMFLVYISGTDDQSEQMNAVWDGNMISGWVKESGAVAVRILSTSEECKFFSQIYPVVCVPSTYCIGDGGIPLEVIGGHMTSEEFVNKLKQAQQTHESQKQNKTTSAGLVASQERMDVSESTPVQEPAPSTSSEDTETSQDVSQTGPNGDQREPVSQSDKVERAKQLIAQKQVEKAQKEFEKSREEEINRRKLGKDLHKLKQSQQDMQMKEVKEQMRKEKEEDKKAREKIRAQIARDREERAQRFQKEKQDREATAEQAKKAKLMEEQKKSAEAEAKKSETARIQVRLPDGSSFTQTFTSTDTLQSLYNIVSEKMGSPITLSTTFPKRVFNEEDMNSSFTELQLAPSAVVLALPRGRSGGQSSSMASQSAGFGGILSMVLYPFTLLWGFVYTLFFGGGGNQSNQQQQQQTSSQDVGSTQSSDRRKRPDTAYQRRSRPDGNMRRMTDMRDDDDDMTTYNGNSTQQL